MIVFALRPNGSVQLVRPRRQFTGVVAGIDDTSTRQSTIRVENVHDGSGRSFGSVLLPMTKTLDVVAAGDRIRFVATIAPSASRAGFLSFTLKRPWLVGIRFPEALVSDDCPAQLAS